MTTGDPVSTPDGVAARAKAIIVDPKREWPVIAAEPATIKSIYIPYVVILAAIGPIATAIGMTLFGFRMLGVVVQASAASAISQAIISYILALVGVFIVSLVIDALAPTFSGVRDRVAAFKVAAYAMTPAWVAGILSLYPPLGGLALIGALYGLYLLYLGLPILMKAPADKALAYTAVTVIAVIVIYAILAVLTAPLVSAVAPVSLDAYGGV